MITNQRRQTRDDKPTNQRRQTRDDKPETTNRQTRDNKPNHKLHSDHTYINREIMNQKNM